MFSHDLLALFSGAILLGIIHGIEPGHGWPVAASAALDRSRKWLWGFAASLILGIGHLISSIAVVLVFFLAKEYFQLDAINAPVVLPGGVTIAGPVGIFAGLLLIGMGGWEYAGAHSHGHSHDHQAMSHGHDEHAHEHEHGHKHDHPHETVHEEDEQVTEGIGETRGLWGIAMFAFLLGFIHEEEFEIIGMCAGSELCLELMLVYAVTVIVAMVGLTMLLIAGFDHFEDRVKMIQPYLPQISAIILIIMGIGFVTGYF